MIAYGYIALRNFPKSERHVLSAEIRHSMLQLQRLIIVCGKKYHKKTTLTELDTELEVLRCQIRLAQTLKYLPFQHRKISICTIHKKLQSWIGHCKHCNSYRLRLSLFKRLDHV